MCVKVQLSDVVGDVSFHIEGVPGATFPEWNTVGCSPLEGDLPPGVALLVVFRHPARHKECCHYRDERSVAQEPDAVAEELDVGLR